jgi:STE24 endopeptidase
MPLPLLIALFLAFGFDQPIGGAPLPRSEVVPRVLEVMGGLALVAALSFGLGHGVARGLARGRLSSIWLRRGYAAGQRGLAVLTLAVFAWIIYEAGWPEVVRSGFGLRGAVLADDVLILLPFLLARLACWWGLYPAEMALRMRAGGDSGRREGLGRYLTLRLRQSLGLVLPVILVLSLGQDLVRRYWPQSAASPWAQLLGLGAMGVLVLLLAPVFVRLACPSHPLPPGPLRDRLEHLMRRLRFRCTDILVWDTGGALCNAGVTGTLPWFRYVLLTDGLIESLDPHQVAAVFGHEVGHIAHRHLTFFGAFFLGSLAVLSLLGDAVDSSVLAVLAQLRLADQPSVVTAALGTVELVGLGLYVLLVFGHLSRRFERQADVFGCRAVSCVRSDCPPHLDPDHSDGPLSGVSDGLCPFGIRVFASALSQVATLNGIRHGRRSWRHGSIARRIAFLEGLEGRPDAERRFQRGVCLLRAALALLLTAAVLIAVAGESVGSLR